MLRLAVLLLALLAPAAAAAQTQLELTSKAADELTAANTRLKTVYDGIAAKYGADSKKRLKEAQDAWKLYSDKQCFFENKGTEGGTIHPMLVLPVPEGADRAAHRRAQAPGELPGGRPLLHSRVATARARLRGVPPK